MIIGLKGRVEHNEMGNIALEVGGVIYGIQVSLLSSLDLKVGEEVRFFITEIIREDAYLLFGFLQKAEQKIFERLIKINGVGPKVAMAILSTYSPSVFASIVEQKNISAIQKVPGIGAKGASKIMVDLAGFFDFSCTQENGYQKAKDEAILALEGLGFKKNEIQNALKGIENEDVAVLIKSALKNLQNI
ncbi:Holliday junction branch migration protein RuvA [Helicobacter cholecystus]|uniref:Holliday junction branch migration complex subunit RuvA n=1 Tax=Helicobacter cholecystus TaxID=45498 RepID=A0A3D8IVC5_9HELI|nr:Holliday junction branch migration protein RuvA [Helicobacter cholecystus]RDU69229.1 Holliday junction branch migration protein RuvA [Helicobacter cholecystus]VEJ24304.1 Holliday junction DNA helicase [Helicobacter cholecystus]